MSHIKYEKNKIKLKFLTILSTCVLLFVCIFIAGSFLTITKKMEYKGINNISELNKVDSYVIAEIDSSADPRLNNMNYIKKYCKIIVYNNKPYKLFAYEFESNENAACYCDLKVIPNTNYNYKYSGNLFLNNTLRVYSGRYAYIVEGKNHSDFVDFYNYLSSEFTVIFN